MNQAFMPEGEDGQHFEAFMAFERVEWREGHARIRVTLGPQHRNRQGFIHGGVIGAGAGCVYWSNESGYLFNEHKKVSELKHDWTS